jgi:hypothetical protein
MACTACLACFISTVIGCNKKRENALEDVVLVAGTQQNLNNLYSLDFYGIYKKHTNFLRSGWVRYQESNQTFLKLVFYR